MPSMVFEREKQAFRDHYGSHLAIFQQALQAALTDVHRLLVASGRFEGIQVTGRIKDQEECIRKFTRKYRTALEESGQAYTIADHITDLIGLRVVCLYEDDIDQVAALIREHVDVIDVTDRVSAMENTTDSFGYKGLHMDFRYRTSPPGMVSADIVDIRYEVQIRTIIQDSWSVLDHQIKYKKSIPNDLKRRINVLSALFELADREFRSIREQTELALKNAPDESANELSNDLDTPQVIEARMGKELNAFTFLKIARHFFPGDSFEPHKVDGFVQSMLEWQPGLTRAEFNRRMRETIAIVKRYKSNFEEQNEARRLNPYTVIRHCLYLSDPTVFHRALNRSSKEAFEAWKANSPDNEP